MPLLHGYTITCLLGGILSVNILMAYNNCSEFSVFKLEH